MFHRPTDPLLPAKIISCGYWVGAGKFAFVDILAFQKRARVPGRQAAKVQIRCSAWIALVAILRLTPGVVTTASMSVDLRVEANYGHRTLNLYTAYQDLSRLVWV